MISLKIKLIVEIYYSIIEKLNYKFVKIVKSPLNNNFKIL